MLKPFVACVAWRRLRFPYIREQATRYSTVKVDFSLSEWMFHDTFFDLSLQRSWMGLQFPHPSHNLHFLFFSEIADGFYEQIRKIFWYLKKVMTWKKAFRRMEQGCCNSNQVSVSSCFSTSLSYNAEAMDGSHMTSSWLYNRGVYYTFIPFIEVD